MPAQVKFLIPVLLLVVTQISARADIPASGCFDLTKTVKPLQAKPDFSEEGINTGSAHRTIERPIREVVEELKSHEVTKSSRASVMDIHDITDSLFFLRQSVHFEVHPFPFVNVAWDEDWAFNLVAGTPQNPEKVIVAYQKAQGTSHISHLCGDFVLTRKNDHESDVALYEEAKATGRTHEDEQKGVSSTLVNLGQDHKN